MNRNLVLSIAASAIIVLLASTAVAQLPQSVAGHRHKAKHFPPSPRPVPGGGQQFGDPLFGLTAAQLAVFEAGREEFESVETAEGGLGPIFNNNACAACHSMAASGGASAITETRFGRRLANGQFDALTALGGTLLHEKAIHPAVQERIPQEANVIAKRLTTPLFGAGLQEAIPDSEILLNAARRKPDGITGRAAMVVDVVSGERRVGHFGWKAQHASVLGFAADAYLNEMGITSRFFPKDIAPNGDEALLARFDKLADPEDVVDPATGKGDIDASADFIRFLAPPPSLRQSVSAAAGERLFQQLNCAACHTPVMFTGANPIAALAHKRVALYSDLLLHDMGRLGDGIVQGTATQREMKTAPLWGLRARGPFLHDGSAATVAEAIRAHDGEGAAARRRYERLSDTEQKQLLDFLNTI